MAKIDSFEELNVWKEAVRIAVEIYRIADTAPLKMITSQEINSLELLFLFPITLLKVLNTITIRFL